jgi:hypothetical protein
VGRLVDLAKSRQVIVFTHRLSLLTLLDSAVKRLKDQADLEKNPAPVVLHVESVRRMGKQAGMALQLSVRDAKPKSAVNRLRDEFIPQLRKMQEDGDVAAYEERVKGVCSDFRILIERCVEDVLLNAVLLRFRRSVQTQGRIGALAKIEAKDCALVDDLMTRYSAFEHSQPEELPATCPELDELSSDVIALATWIEEFSKRAVN